MTVNWQADTIEKVEYKHKLTNGKVILVDRGTKVGALLARLGSDVVVVNVDEALMSERARSSNPSLAEEDFCTSSLNTDTRIVIFTSGTTGDPKGVW